MATLEEYLGALVSNISRARVLSDIESAKIAMIYEADDLLKHFTIPRMKIDDVEMTIPIAVDELDIEKTERIKPLDVNKLASLSYSQILTVLNIQSLPMDISREFRAEISKISQAIPTDINRNNFEKILKEYSTKISEFLSKNLDILIRNEIIKLENDNERKRITSELSESLLVKSRELINFEPVKEQLLKLNVTFESNRLKEKKPETLLYIKMKVSEEGMEWERYDEGDGNIVSKLMPA